MQIDVITRGQGYPSYEDIQHVQDLWPKANIVIRYGNQQGDLIISDEKGRYRLKSETWDPGKNQVVGPSGGSTPPHLNTGQEMSFETNSFFTPNFNHLCQRVSANKGFIKLKPSFSSEDLQSVEESLTKVQYVFGLGSILDIHLAIAPRHVVTAMFIIQGSTRYSLITWRNEILYRIHLGLL